MRRLTHKLRKLLRDANMGRECESWCRESTAYYEQHVFFRKAMKTEMKIIFYRYLQGHGIRRVAKTCRVSERYVQEFLEMMKMPSGPVPASRGATCQED